MWRGSVGVAGKEQRDKRYDNVTICDATAQKNLTSRTAPRLLNPGGQDKMKEQRCARLYGAQAPFLCAEHTLAMRRPEKVQS